MIPVSEPLFGEEEKRNLIECIETGWVSSDGPFVKRFEQCVADYVGMKHGIAVSSGTAALDIAIETIGLGKGDEIIIPAFTIISCVMQVVRAGATPVLVDCDPKTWTIDPDAAISKITSRTKAILPVHIYGHPVDMDPILDAAGKYGLVVIEDAAECHGGLYKGRRCGGLGDISIFSFYANKVVTTGEGGMVLTNDDTLAETAESLRNLCFQPERRFIHERLGFNYRMTNLQAALGVAQMRKIDRFVQLKRKMASSYSKRLSKIPGITLPVEKKWATNMYWMYGIVLSPKLGIDARELSHRLAARGIATRPFFQPLHLQPVLRRMGLFEGESYPVAERIARYGLYLPSGLTMDEKKFELVCEAIEDSLK